ncbi:MAG: ribosomal protein S18-alanine N-acetyltransferase [Fidelibacterota bacterium]
MERKPKVRIRRANESDLATVIAIENLSFNTPWTPGFFTHELYNPVSYFYILEIQDKLAGYVIFWIFREEAHIANVAVHPEYRRKGYGEQLLNWVIHFCRRKRVETISLEVNEVNYTALQLYAKAGFTQVGRRTKYYENRYDALLLTKILT